MILSDRDIEKRLEDGDLGIEPLDDPELQIQPASVDLRLGTEFLEFRNHGITCIHPDRPSEVEGYTERQARLEDYQPDSEKNYRRQMDEGDAYVLHPGDFVLGTTYERVSIPDDLVARVEGRSSLGRLAIVVHASLPADEELYLWTPEEGFGFHEIGEVVEHEPNARAVSFDPETMRVRTFQITDFITNPTKRIYCVTLDSGREVNVTRDHNVFTLDRHGEITRVASEDAEGELVMVPGTLPEPMTPTTELDLLELFGPDDDDVIVYASDGLGAVDWERVPDGSTRHYDGRGSAPLSAVPRADTPADAEVAFKQSDARLPRRIDVTPELGWVLGFYIAEGYARRRQLVFTNTDDALLDRVADWFARFDTVLSSKEVDDGADQLVVCSALWSKIFRRLAAAGADKNLPERAWNWSDEVLEAFLEGLLDGDGHRREERDTLYTANEDLADRATYLGARLGYATSTYHRERDNAAESDEWSVDFYDDAHKRGQYVPNPSELLRSLRDEAGLTMAEAAEAMGRSSKSSVSNVENEEYDRVKRETLRAFRDCYADHGADVSRLDAILEEDVRFERVKAVDETERVETTYDLEVQPDGRAIENFLGGFGGVFLSNTAGFIDPGYEGQITLELSNLGEAPVALRPKEMRVSQLVFTQLSSPARRPYGEERDSKYQDQAGPTASRIQDDEEWRPDEGG